MASYERNVKLYYYVTRPQAIFITHNLPFATAVTFPRHELGDHKSRRGTGTEFKVHITRYKTHEQPSTKRYRRIWGNCWLESNNVNPGFSIKIQITCVASAKKKKKKRKRTVLNNRSMTLPFSLPTSTATISFFHSFAAISAFFFRFLFSWNRGIWTRWAFRSLYKQVRTIPSKRNRFST